MRAICRSTVHYVWGLPFRLHENGHLARWDFNESLRISRE